MESMIRRAEEQASADSYRQGWQEILQHLVHRAYGHVPSGTVSVSAPVTPRREPQTITIMEPDNFRAADIKKTLVPVPPMRPGRRSCVELVRLGGIAPHPTPHTVNLEVTRVFGLPVVVGKGEFRRGDIAVYVPVGAILPPAPELEFIHQDKHYVVGTRNFRGVESCGVLLPVAEYFMVLDRVTGDTLKATPDVWNAWLAPLVGTDVSGWFKMTNPI